MIKDPQLPIFAVWALTSNREKYYSKKHCKVVRL